MLSFVNSAHVEYPSSLVPWDDTFFYGPGRPLSRPLGGSCPSLKFLLDCGVVEASSPRPSWQQVLGVGEAEELGRERSSGHAVGSVTQPAQACQPSRLCEVCPQLHDDRTAGVLSPSLCVSLHLGLLVPRLAMGRERNSDGIEADVGVPRNDFGGWG